MDHFQIVSSLPITPQHRAAWLMLPVPGDEEDDATHTRCFLNLAEKKLYKIKNVFEPFLDAWCVGSSHGCLILLDEKANPHLFNPFSNATIQLPSFPAQLKPAVPEAYFVEHLRKHFISKAVFLLDEDNKSAVVVVIYGTPSKLAFCNNFDNTWSDLGGTGSRGEEYSDIICYNNQLYALTDSGSVQLWDFRSNPPKKIMNFRPSGQSTVNVDMENFPQDKFSNRFYLVESSGDLLLVNRVFGNFFNSEGVAIDEAGLLDTEDTHPLVCPYRTKQFHVYKLDSIRNTWEKVESLPDQTMFLGGNHSLSLSTWDLHEGCETNTIYFTDDNWAQMNEDYLYGGHDLGQFNLASGNLQTGVQCCCLYSERMDPPPFWIIP
ncbi:putative F-box protein At5g38270 [Corylus avellana]|uniref:putative F-box protein At5g38270 n=1 Tax=Corylus avellana TaxID=13451 RepID=UPI00286BABF1|nr:putative F-box protein At5g38270 [Corylus avellana]